MDGNYLLYSYISLLDHEIAMRVNSEHKEMIKRMLDALRTFGWCVVRLYDEDDDRDYNVFTPVEFSDWIRVTGSDGRIIKVGARFLWVDELGNSYNEECIWDVRAESPLNAYYFVWNRGDNLPKRYRLPDTVFADGDLPLAVLSSAIAAHQIKVTLEISATKPYFLHFIYGDSASDESIRTIENNMKYVGPTVGIGAKESVLLGINPIQSADLPSSIEALNQLTRMFANITRLPLSFYMGEKMTGGLGDTGETIDELKIDEKRREIFEHFNEICGEMFRIEFGETLEYESSSLSRAERITPPSPEEVISNGSEGQRLNQSPQTLG